MLQIPQLQNPTPPIYQFNQTTANYGHTTTLQNPTQQHFYNSSQQTNSYTTTMAPEEKLKGKRDLNPNKKKRVTTMKKIIKSEREQRRHQKIEQLSKVLAPQQDVPTLPEELIEKIADCMLISTEDGGSCDDLESSNLNNSEANNESFKNNNEDSSIDYENTVSLLPKQFPAIHSRRFREYCNQVLDASLDSNCIKLIECIKRRQDKQMKQQREKEEARKNQSNYVSRDFNQGPKVQKSIVMGLREVTKHAKAGNLKLVVVAPNLEKVQSKGGLDDAVEKLKTACSFINPGAGKNEPTPIAFALSRIALGRALNRSVPISTLGIRSVVGFEKEYKKVIDLLEASKDRYSHG